MPDSLWRGACFFLIAVVIFQLYLLVSTTNTAVPDFLEGAHSRPQEAESISRPPEDTPPQSLSQSQLVWTYDAKRDASNIGLSQEQCKTAFPDLYYEVDRAVSYWHDLGHTITPEDTGIEWRRNGAFRVLIHDNQLRILETKQSWVPFNYRKRTFYTLLQMHRALLGAQASGEKLPNIEFSVTLDDMSLVPGGSDNTKTIWTYARHLGHRPEEKLWMMPDFEFFAAPPFAGSFPEMQGKAQIHDGPVSEKIPKIVWRGRSGTNKDVRGALLSVTEGKEWADVIETGFGDVEDAPNRLSMDDLCRYQFVAHTEGRSWSGRLKFLLNCDSIPVIHKLDWTAEYYHLLKADGPEQNYVQVERDWSDLESKIKHYLDNPQEAQRIADNAKATFRSKYTSPAAEACYWRYMIRGYSSVSFDPELHETVVVNVSGQVEDQQRLRGWSFEQFLWSDEKRGVGWNFQDRDP